MGSQDLLYGLGRSTAILIIGFALARWAFKSGHDRVWIWWTVLFGTILSFLPLPNLIIALPRPLGVPKHQVYEAGRDYSNHLQLDGTSLTFGNAVTVVLAVGAILFVARMYWTWRHLRASEQIAKAEILHEVADIGSAVGVDRIPLVLASQDGDSAYATGMLNPAIVLPQRTIDAAPEDERRAILCHEMLHLKRKDHWFVALIDLWCCLFFWNPIAWIGRNQAFHAMEEANDERTVSSGLVAKTAYLRALLSGAHPMVAAPIARFHGQSSLRARIEAIAKGESKHSRFYVLAACVLITAIAMPLRLEAMPYLPSENNGTQTGQIGPDEVVFSSGHGDRGARAYRMRQDGSGVRPLLPIDEPHGQSDVSPDGTKVAFITGRDDEYDIYVRDLDGGNLVPIADTPGNDVQPHFSPDGTQIIYTSRRDQIWQIYLYDLETKTTTRVSDPRYRELEARWHPNGQRIIFSSYRTGIEKIWSMNLDGSDLVQISQGTTTDTGGIYSRCGRYAIYMKTSGGGYDLYRMDLELGEELRLTHAMGDDGEANVSPDNRWIYFTTGRNRKVQIARMNLSGTDERVIGPIEGSWPQSRPVSEPSRPAR